MNIVLCGVAISILQAATIQGRVLQSDMTEGISRAILELKSADAAGSIQYSVASTDGGIFAFHNVQPGNYRLAAKRPGFVSTEYGARKASGQGVTIEVRPDTLINDLIVPMAPSGAIYGRVYDNLGRPVVKAEVQAMKPAYQDDRRVLSAVQTTQTNDLGEYRLFWLDPGRYYVGVDIPNWNVSSDVITLNASAPTSRTNPQASRFSVPVPDPIAPVTIPRSEYDENRYRTVYFPNTPDALSAQPIDIGPGANHGGVDVMITPVSIRKIKGVVIDSETGLPAIAGASGTRVQLVVFPPLQGTGSPFTNRETGEFEAVVMTGEAVLTAVISGRKAGRITITPGDRDVDGVRIVIGAGYDIPGQIVFEGAQPGATDPRFSSLRVTVRAQPQPMYTPTQPQQSGRPSNSGGFTIQNLIPGLYSLNVSPILNTASGTAPAIEGALENAYVSSIRQGSVDVLNDFLRVEGRPEEPLLIVIGTTPGGLTGVATPDATVVLAPAGNRNRTDLFRSTIADADGRFRLTRIVPGDYKLFAWDEVIPGAWRDREFMAPSEEQGVAVRVAPNSKQDVQVSVIQ
jgi:protocatechuate 3,4-dioxygenase beta subunit